MSFEYTIHDHEFIMCLPDLITYVTVVVALPSRSLVPQRPVSSLSWLSWVTWTAGAASTLILKVHIFGKRKSPRRKVSIRQQEGLANHLLALGSSGLSICVKIMENTAPYTTLKYLALYGEPPSIQFLYCTGFSAQVG